MRSNSPIKITIEIPFPISSEPDRNRIIYTKEAIGKAAREFDGEAPLMMVVKDEIGTVIGHIEKLELSDNYEVTTHRICYFGWTCEEGNVKDNTITDFRFLSFGISEK